MSNNANRIVTNTKAPDDAIEVWGQQSDIDALGERLRRYLPGGNKLTSDQAAALAQYAQVMDANPFRGEIYAWADWRGQFVMSEGYKLLVRWARRQSDFFDRAERFTAEEKAAQGLQEKDVAYRVYLLREDKQASIRAFIEMGATFDEAYRTIATCATGVVRKTETWNAKKNRAIDPPKGWTWDQVAVKRGLKTAINMAYGAPSPREIAAETWLVGDVETAPGDWSDIPDHIAKAGYAAEYAAQVAHTRETVERVQAMTPDELQAQAAA